LLQFGSTFFIVALAVFVGQGVWALTTQKSRRLTNSDRLCSNSRAKPTGISKYTGQRIKPPALDDISPETKACMNMGQDKAMLSMQNGIKASTMPPTSIQLRVRALRRLARKSIRTCALFSKP